VANSKTDPRLAVPYGRRRFFVASAIGDIVTTFRKMPPKPAGGQVASNMDQSRARVPQFWQVRELGAYQLQFL